MPRSTGIGRTGKKHKRKYEEASTEASQGHESKVATLEAAIAKSEAAQLAVEDEDVVVLEWLGNVLEQVMVQARIDDAKARSRQRSRDMHAAVVVACAESLKRRVLGRGDDAEWCALRPFYDALHQNVREWEDAFPEDRCSDCERHLARCICRAPCKKCRRDVPRRAWSVCYLFPERDVCLCEKLGDIMHLAMRVL